MNIRCTTQTGSRTRGRREDPHFAPLEIASDRRSTSSHDSSSCSRPVAWYSFESAAGGRLELIPMNRSIALGVATVWLLAASTSSSGCSSGDEARSDGGTIGDTGATGERGESQGGRSGRADGSIGGVSGTSGAAARGGGAAGRAPASGAGGANGTDGGSRAEGGNGTDGAAELDSSADALGGCSKGMTLRCAAGGRFVGSAVRFNALSSDPEYPVVLGREFSSITPEDDAKWTPLEPTRGVWTFDKLDAIVSAAEAHGQAIHGHALVWYYEIPTWATALSASELSVALHEHITKTALRYKGRMRAWDVLNEAIDDSTLALRTGIDQTLGVAGLADAFKWVHAADPAALLFYNDYGVEDLSRKSQAVYDLVQQLEAAGAPVDGVGVQSHLTTLAYPSVAGLRANIQRFASLGLKVRISELDVRTVSVPGDRATRLAQERIVYQTVGGACANEPSCEGVTSWGFTDRYSWIDGAFAPDDPLEFDDGYQPKPAYQGLLEGLQGKLPTAGPNLLANGDCSSISGWEAFGGGTIASIPGGRTGAACRVTARTLAYQGPSQSLLGNVASGDTITLTAWVRVSVPSAPVYATLKATIGGKDIYQSIASATATNTGWALLTGNGAQGWTTEPTSFQVYIEGPDPGADILVDDASVSVLSAR